jgi:hypothetical protein
MRTQTLSALLLSLPLVLVGACTSDDGSGPTDKPELPGDTGGPAPTATYGELDCTDWFLDVWSVPLVEGDVLQANVDTVADETSFDPVLFATWEPGPAMVDYVIWEDDNMECTYDTPMADAACPRLMVTADRDASLQLVVDVAQDPCASDIAAYKLTVKVNGEPVLATLIFDDYLDDW